MIIIIDYDDYFLLIDKLWRSSWFWCWVWAGSWVHRHKSQLPLPRPFSCHVTVMIITNISTLLIFVHIRDKIMYITSLNCFVLLFLRGLMLICFCFSWSTYCPTSCRKLYSQTPVGKLDLKSGVAIPKCLIWKFWNLTW